MRPIRSAWAGSAILLASSTIKSVPSSALSLIGVLLMLHLKFWISFWTTAFIDGFISYWGTHNTPWGELNPLFQPFLENPITVIIGVLLITFLSFCLLLYASNHSKWSFKRLVVLTAYMHVLGAWSWL
jgi:hypothetical protein